MNDMIADTVLGATRAGDYTTLKALLADGASCSEECDERGRSALHHAVLNNDANVAALLAHDADVEGPADFNGATPLHLAACRTPPASEGVIRTLLVSSADPRSVDQNRWTPLHYAALHGHDCVLPQLLATIDGSDTILATDFFDNNPLHWAAVRGHVPFVVRLLHDVNAPQVLEIALLATNSRHKTAADLSYEHGHKHLHRLLEAFRLHGRRRSLETASLRNWTTDKQEVEELRNQLGIGAERSQSAPLARRQSVPAAQPAFFVKADAAAGVAVTSGQRHRRQSLQQLAARNIVSFDAADGGMKVHGPAGHWTGWGIEL